MFYVIDKNTGEPVEANGFWAVGENGQLYDVMDGWGCEGGGGSSVAPANFVAVLGVAPCDVTIEQEPARKAPKVYAFRCSCGQRFVAYTAAANHVRDTRQPGPHDIVDF